MGHELRSYLECRYKPADVHFSLFTCISLSLRWHPALLGGPLTRGLAHAACESGSCGFESVATHDTRLL